MATIIPFPIRPYQPSGHDALRERLQPVADLAERLGPLDTEAAAGLCWLALAVVSGDPERIDGETLRERLAGDIDAATWVTWLRAIARTG